MLAARTDRARHGRSILVVSILSVSMAASVSAAVPASVATPTSMAAPTPMATQQDSGVFPLTRAERSGWLETSRYEDVMQFLREVTAGSDRMRLTTFGYSLEGRALPLVVVGNEVPADAAGMRASGKLRVYLQGNIHAGEVCGKEALQMLLREIAAGEHDDWLQSQILLIAPIYNADGNERISLDNRPGQNGPLGGMGQRSNAQDLDLNRDHMKVESPEARSLLGLFRDYDPHVTVDLHTTNGTRHAYQLTYSPPLNPATAAPIVQLLRQEWLAAVTASVRADHGQEFYYYGNLPFRQGVERGWYTFDHRPRFSNNYAGLRNRFGILGEAYAYSSFEERVRSSRNFVEAILDWTTVHHARVAETVAATDARSVVGTSVPLRAELQRSETPVEILLGEAAIVAHPYSGRRMLQRLDTVTPETMYEFGTFRPTLSTVAPAAYLVPAELGDVIDRLRVHGVEMEPLQAATTLAAERFVISAMRQEEREFQGHRERTIDGTWEPEQAQVPAGTLRIDVAQPLGRLAVYLLEPQSDDGLADWNFLDAAIESDGFYPILRIPAAR